MDTQCSVPPNHTAFVLLGVGNRLGGDDGVGPYVADCLAASGWAVFDCGTAPENFTAAVRRLCPAHVVIVDAALMGLPPGEFRRISLEDVGGAGFTTHTLPLSLLARFIRADGPAVTLIGVEPGDLSPTERLSPAVQAGARRLADCLAAGALAAIPILNVEGPAL